MEATPDIQNKQTQMRKGLLAYTVLLSISQKESYASDILARLQSANLILVEGTLYPLLSRFQREDLLEYSWQESKSGPPRKYYRLTPHGEQTLKALSQTWQELSQSITTLQN